MIPKHVLTALADTAPLGYDPDHEEVYCVYCHTGERCCSSRAIPTMISTSRLSNPYAHPADCPWRELVDTMEVE